jgi:glutathione S-transferase
MRAPNITARTSAVALTFYYGSGSPYAWRVWLALEHKQVPYTMHTLSFSAGDLRKAEYAAINPRQKVPAIVDDGFSLYESVAIIEYLQERYPQGAALFPGDLRERAIVRRMVQEADQYFAVTMEKIVDQVLFTPQDKWDLEAIDAARTGLAGELQRWELLMRADYLAGSVPSAADFTLYPLIALTLRLQKKKPDLDVPALIGPRVSSWMQRLEALPYFQKTWPPHWK